MGDSKFNMPEPEKGDPLTSKMIKQIISGALNALVGGAGIIIKQVNDKVIIENAYTHNGNDADIIWAEVKAVKHDYLECYLVNPIDYTGDKEVKVAKPEWLRKTPYHEKSVKFADGMIATYTYTSFWERTAAITAGGTYTEMITPNYATRADNTAEGRCGHGSLICVKQINTGVLDEDGAAIAYLEVTGTNGRDWAVKP